ncbi:MAG: sodium:proton antiporter [Phycisphaeraceae bacterium]|nr:sodium:proton antiporter [Phycisphaeraceae bacterium]
MSTATQSLAMAFGIGALISTVSSRLRIPSVLPLLIAGVAVGRSGLGLVDTASIGDTFRALVALSIGLLVFEGGLHLDRRELGRAPRAVLGLLTIGALITWLGVAALAVYILGMDWPIGLVLGSIVIVTGPTVIQPILRQVRLSPNLHAALSAEAILIDPIGVIVSVSTLELVLAYYEGAFEGAWPNVVRGLAMPVGGGFLVGAVVGILGAGLLRIIGRHGPSLNVAATGLCMLAIGAGEMVAAEGGLVAATIAAVILANTHVVATSDVRQFKEQVATLLVGMLFVLLAAQMDITRLPQLNYKHVLFIGGILLLVRPVGVAVASLGTQLELRERAFAGLFAPRGIVAASVAALAVVRLSAGLESIGTKESAVWLAQAQSLDIVVFAIIIVSVVWATVAAWPLGKALGVLAGPPRGVMIVGAHGLGREAARALVAAKVPVLLIDANARRCEVAKRDGLTVAIADATDGEQLGDMVRMHEIGWVFAWTGNDDVDRVVGRWAAKTLGKDRVLVGLPEAPRAKGENGNGGAQQGVRHFERMLHDGIVHVSIAEPAAGVVPLLSVDDGAPRSTDRAKAKPDESWLVLSRVPGQDDRAS